MTATATPPKHAAARTTATQTLLTPHVVCRDVRSAIAFCKRAFGADEVRVVRTLDGGILHAGLTIGGAMLLLADEAPAFGSRSPQALRGTPVTLHLHVPDSDAVFARAVGAGCAVRMPLADMFWGDRYGVVQDPYGHAWSIATHVRDVSHEDVEKGAAACGEQMK